MKHVIAALLILATSMFAAETKDEFPNFMGLKKAEAAKVARRQAEADFASGHYRMLVFGLRAHDPAQDKRLAKDGVEVKAVAGCIVSEGLVEGARVYNEIMREKLKAKLGRDVFSDKDEAMKGNQK